MNCLLYTSDAADDLTRVDLGGRRIIKKKLESGFPSVPSTIKDELNCNIFLRAKNQEEFSKLRDLKDNF